VKRLEAVTIGVGAILLVVALAAVDWRLGAGFAGLVLIISSLDISPRRRT